MDDLGYKIDGAFLSSHRKVSDLIIIDGPVLSHFVNENKENFFYYWIDQNEQSYRWLIFKIDAFNLKEYLGGNHTLRELILSDNVQYFFTADYSNSDDKVFENVRMLDKQSLSEEYLPDKESYYLFEIPKVYENLLSLKELNQTEYIQLLREKAIYIKFAEKEPLHRHIPSIESLTSFLSNIKKSYQCYVEESYKKNFIALYASLDDFKKACSRILEGLQLRVVDAKIASFGVGLSTDSFLMSNDIKREVKEWSSNLINDYNNEVIDLDYTDSNNLDRVLKNYSPESRKNIFKPILDLYTNPRVEVSVSTKNLQNVSRVKRPSKYIVKQLTEIPTLLKPPSIEKEFVTLAVEIEKGTDLESIPKKVFSSQPLFEKRSDSIELTKNELVFESTRILFKKQLTLNISLKNEVHVVSSPQLNISVQHTELSEALNLLAMTIFDNWTRFLGLSTSIEEYKKLSNSDRVMIAVFELVDQIK